VGFGHYCARRFIIAQLRRRPDRAEAIIELQKKLTDLLGLELPQIGPSNAA
jgi:hypothetical protein